MAPGARTLRYVRTDGNHRISDRHQDAQALSNLQARTALAIPSAWSPTTTAGWRIPESTSPGAGLLDARLRHDVAGGLVYWSARLGRSSRYVPTADIFIDTYAWSMSWPPSTLPQLAIW